MQATELKIKKWKVRTGCVVWLFFVTILIYSLFTRFSINLFDAQRPLLVMNYSAKYKPSFMVPFYWLFLQLCMIFYFIKMLYEWYILARKGYVARMRPDGVLLADDRVIPWHEIETIEAIEGGPRMPDKVVITLKAAPTKNTIFALFKKMSNEKIVLTQFSLPLYEACELLSSNWHQYR